MKTWSVHKRGEYPIIKMEEYVQGMECDKCGRIVPFHYMECIGQEQIRRYYACKNVIGTGGLLHRKCYQ